MFLCILGLVHSHVHVDEDVQYIFKISCIAIQAQDLEPVPLDCWASATDKNFYYGWLYNYPCY